MQSTSFDDFDAFSAAVRDAEVEMMLLKPDRREWSIRHVDVGGVHVQFGCEGSGDLTRGRGRSDGVVVFLATERAEVSRANGERLDSNRVVVIEPGSEFCLTTSVPHEWCSVFVPSQRAVDAGLIADARLASPECRTVRGIPRRFDRFVKLLRRFAKAADHGTPLSAGPAASAAAAELLTAAARLVGGAEPGAPRVCGRRPYSRAELFEGVKSALAAGPTPSLRVPDLAAAVGVSERTLRTVFREFYGVCPKEFLVIQCLHDVRRDLRSAEPGETTVADVLVRNGVWEFGRFAGRYRRTFGESPSETLRRRHPLGASTRTSRVR